MFSQRFHLATALLVCLAAAAFAGGGDDWRPVTPDDLAQKEGKVEKDADAEALFWEVRIDDSSEDELAEKHYVRVKIFTERGREKFSKIDIPYISGTKIKDVLARVIKPDGSIVEIPKESIFDREIIKAGGAKLKAKSFAVPGIEAGVIVEYKYKEVTEDAGASGMQLIFQKDIPVQSISYYYKPFNNKAPVYQWFNMPDTQFVKDKGGFYVATRTNVPSMKEEPEMPPDDEVLPWYLLQSVSPQITDVGLNSIHYVIKNPGDKIQYWGAVANENGFIAKLIDDAAKSVKNTASEVTGSAATTDDKLRKLYEYCQKQIKNTSFDTTLTDDMRAKLPKNKNIADVIKNKSGSAMDIDLLFAAMAVSQGMDARMAILADRSKKFFDPEMTNEHFIHKGVIGVRDGERYRFFDPGVSFLPYETLVWKEEDVWALLIGEKNYYWLKTPYSTYDKTAANRTGKFRLNEDGSLEGEVHIEYSGQLGVVNRMDIYDESQNKREDDLREEIKRRISSAELSDITIDNLNDSSKPLVYNFKVKVPNYAQKTGKRLFLQPGFFEYGESTLFPGSERKYRIYFHYPWSENDKIEIGLPSGFALDSADAPVPVGDTGRIGGLEIKMGTDKDQTKLFYDRKFFFGGGGNYLFEPVYYKPLKELFDNFYQADSHTITIKQK
jgi:hypothetical protein